MARKGSYLYKRKGSENFWLRLVYPPELSLVLGKARIERSLGVSNRIEAEAKASEEIRKHKLSLLAVQRLREGKPQPVGAQKRFPPMTEHLVDGLRVVATDDELIFFDQESKFVRKEANFLFVDLTNTIEFALKDVSQPWLSHGTAKTARRFMKPEDTKADDDILERWIRHRKITPHIERDARNVWRYFKEIIGNKPLRQCKPIDARLFVEALQETGITDKTISKKLSYLTAACNIAIRDGELEFNPFSGASPYSRRNPQQARITLTEADMALVRVRPDNHAALARRLTRIMTEAA